MDKYKGYLIIGLLSASLSAVILRQSDLHPLVISFYRMLIASIVLMPFAVMELKKNPIPLRSVMALIGVGCILSFHFGFWNTAVQMTTVASATILMSANPLFVIPLSHKSMGESFGKTALLGVLIAFFGIIVLSYGDISGGNLLGDLIALLSGLALAFYLVAGRKARGDGARGESMGLFTYVWIVYSACTIFTLIAVIALGEFTTSIPQKEWYVFIALVIFPTLLGHTMMNASLKKLKAGVVSTAILSEPLIATLLAVFFLSEIPPSLTLVGGALILFGLVVVVRKEA